MKSLSFIILLVSFSVNSQSIEVVVNSTNTEISGSTYDINSSSNQDIDLVLTFFNNTNSEQIWDLERVRPPVQNWHDWSMSWALMSNPLAGNDFIIYPDPIWITPIDMTIPQDDSVYVSLRYQPLTDGCDFNTYYILHNDVRVDSFNINICKTVGLDEIADDNISIYPNPANSELTILFENQTPDEVSVIDLVGDEIATLEASNSMIIATNNLPNGMYFLSWKMNGFLQRQKFQVQH